MANEYFADLRQQLLTDLQQRRAQPGEMVDFGWFNLRVLPFWLLPSEYTVVFGDGSQQIIPPGTDIEFMDDFSTKPWWQFW